MQDWQRMARFFILEFMVKSVIIAGLAASFGKLTLLFESLHGGV